MLNSFLKSQIDLPVYLVGVLFTALIFDLSTVTGANLLSDGEFAEFEDPDDIFISDLADPPGTKSSESSLSRAADENSSDAVDKKADIGSGIEDEQDEDIPLINRKPIPFDKALHPVEADDSTVEQEELEELVPRDDEEFEGFTPPTPDRSSQASPSKGKRPDLIMTKVPRHLTGSWDSYQLEMLIVALLFVYFCNYLIGRQKNTQLAAAWFESHKPLLEAQFALVGDDGQIEPGSGTLLKESEHLYSLWCSGRACCEALLIELRLVKRQCLVVMLSSLLRPVCDTIVSKVILEEGEMDGWVMAVGRKRRLQALAKDHQDLAFFCPDKRGQRHPSLPESLTVLSELPEATTSMLNAPVCKFLTENEEAVDYLFFSDQYTGPKPPPDEAPSSKLPVAQKVLIFSFRVGTKGSISTEDMESLTPLFQFIFYMIEKAHRFRLGKESKLKSEKNRQRAYESRLKAVHSQRQEAAQTRREERARATKERILAENDPEKARKLEEREQRKEKSKKLPKMKMLKSKGM